MIERGFWVSPVYLDHDLYIYNKSFYNQLRIAIKLSTRILWGDDFKIFDGEWWLENRYSDVEITDFAGYPKSNSTQWLAHPLSTHREVKQFHFIETNTDEIDGKIEMIKQDLFHFLNAINELVKKELVLEKGNIPDDEYENMGWKDSEKYYLLYGKTWKWVENYLKESNYVTSFPNKDIEIKLYEQEIIEIEEEKRSGRKRADCNTTVYPKKKERVFKISISRLEEFIDTYNGMENH